MDTKNFYLSLEKQLQRWGELNEWLKKAFSKEAIPDGAFVDMLKKIENQNSVSQSRLFYGFGDDGQGNADPLWTGHIFVTYLTEKYPNEKWRFIDFYPTEPDPSQFDFYRPKVKMRSGSADRPKGFYIKDLLPKDFEEGVGTTFQKLSPADVRKLSMWGWGPEGFEFLAVESDYAKQVIENKVPMFVLADYSVSPYGEPDFSSTIFLGNCRGKLELGVTNVRDNIPKFSPSHFA